MSNKERLNDLLDQIRGGKADAYIVATKGKDASKQLVSGGPVRILVMVKSIERSLKSAVEKEGLPYELIEMVAEEAVKHANHGEEVRVENK